MPSPFALRIYNNNHPGSISIHVMSVRCIQQCDRHDNCSSFIPYQVYVDANEYDYKEGNKSKTSQYEDQVSVVTCVDVLRASYSAAMQL